MTDTMTSTHGVSLTDAAAAKVRSLLEQEGRDDLRLRLAVQPGGCSGLIYQLYFDERMLDGDSRRDFDGVEVVVDKMSVPYLEGARSRASRSTTRTRAAAARAETASTEALPPDPRAGHPHLMRVPFCRSCTGLAVISERRRAVPQGAVT